MRYDATEYLYASARIRALEARLLDRRQLDRLLSAASVGEILDSLWENSPRADRRKDTDTAEALIQERLREAVQAVSESVPDPSLLRLVQYPYDCHNLKVLEKCRHKGTDPRPLLVDLGSIDVKSLLTVSKKELSALLPSNMAQATEECSAIYARTADPREIDFLLDRATFADMAAAAAPFPLAAQWVRERADLSNLLFCLRLLRMKSAETGRSVLERALLPCGSLSPAFLMECYDGGEELFYDKIARTSFAGVFEKGMALSEAERAADDRLMALIRQARSIPFGAEVPVAYLLATEAESKNLRILLAGKKAGLDRDTISHRMRACYV